ncbi:zinc-binding protein A33-like [Sinocyclocheilus grahami]|uniref:Zinc-binding protein A33-like n=1 Tax=Sinocyclocheilus grahami TaxID=75366 RepID=A0A672MCV6_SINGR|nr:PREDICTED: zinc-binding protein A33-like [Sinocyclocheilus grahami]
MHTNHMKDTNNNFNNSLLGAQKEKLIQAIKKIKHEIDECYEAEKEAFVDALEVENRFEAIEREIRAEFQNLHRFLDEEEETDLERLRKERDRRVKILKEREKKIGTQSRDLEKAIETLNCKLREDDSPKLLKEIKELLKRCEVNFIRPPAIDSEILSGQFVGPIQYRIWKHMKTSLYPNISMLTFDPETAHPHLTLSAEKNSVTFEEDKVLPNENPDERNPKRFHFYYCVMGSEAFTHGRHYWEVEVKGKTAWRVGVARADIPRGEMDSSSTLNGLWTLSLRNGSITACTHPKPTKVLSYTLPIRIGIFLDCDKEEVSFYNAVTMTSLFSFYIGTVLVPLYPFYNPCDTDEEKNCAPLSIFHPSL